MVPRTEAVKQKRPYDSRRRDERARHNRDRILTTAERRFLDDGYASTTVAAIAADANVSADSIYKTFVNKAGLVRAIRSRALAGNGAVPAEQRSDELHRTGRTGREIVEAWGGLTAEVAPRIAPIALLLLTAAATDPEAKALLLEIDDDRHRRMTDNARQLRDAGHLRKGISLAQAADILWTYSAPELYELLVLRRGWTPKRFGSFVAASIIDSLLDR